jgi:acyl-CoA synthetase (AMP-forming)/AMP-acid ligase II
MIYRSPLPDVVIPELSYPALALANAEELGDRAAFIDAASGRTLSYRELRRQVRAVAAGLSEMGVRKGEVFALALPNCPEFAVAVYAITSLGGIVTPVNPLYTPGELVHQLLDAGARYLLTLPELLESYRTALRSAGLKHLFVLGAAADATSLATLAAHPGAPPLVAINPRRDIAFLPYSSGTTGLPKGVMLSHYNLVANLCQIRHGPNRLRDDGEVIVGVPPMFHIYGITMYLGVAPAIGATVVSQMRFDFVQFIESIARYRATFVVVVPPVALGMLHHPTISNYDLTSVRMIVSSAAPLAPAIAEGIEERLGVKVRQGFGMTELAGASHVQRPEDPPQSVGVALPNVRWKVVDTDGAALTPGRHGEICVQSPAMMRGYLNRAEATAATLDAEGWLHTGDLGYADEAGRCFLVDRLKELIKFKGYQVAPAELEAVLLTHPAVVDAGCIPRPDEEAGEVPIAYVVRRGDVDAETLLAYVAARVAPYKKLRAIEFVDALPKSPAGKLLRRVLIERARAQP